MTRDPFDDLERERDVARDFEREPSLRRARPRATEEELHLRAMAIGFSPKAGLSDEAISRILQDPTSALYGEIEALAAELLARRQEDVAIAQLTTPRESR